MNPDEGGAREANLKGIDMSRIREIYKMGDGLVRLYCETRNGNSIYEMYMNNGLPEDTYPTGGFCFVNNTDKSKADYGQFSKTFYDEEKMNAAIDEAAKKYRHKGER